MAKFSPYDLLVQLAMSSRIIAGGLPSVDKLQEPPFARILSDVRIGSIAQPGPMPSPLRHDRRFVELLCNGDQLEQHSGRVSQSESNGSGILASDYIILDFRKTRPNKLSHPNMCIVYPVIHISFFFGANLTHRHSKIAPRLCSAATTRTLKTWTASYKLYLVEN